MGRRGGWIEKIALLLVALVAGCGDTGGGSSSSSQPFVFQARGRLSLIAQPVVTGSNSLSVRDLSSRAITDPTVLSITAILIDPQGNPFRNQRITFEAEFVDATIIPANTPENQPLACLPQANNGNATRCTNRGAAITDDFGQAQVTLVAGVTLGPMRVTAEAPAPLNISSAISVDITTQGFLGGVDLAIIPTSVTFINPLVQPGTDGPMTVFNAVGGKPPYTWSNADPSVGRLDIQVIPGTTIASKATYTLIGAIPPDTTTGSGSASTDTVTLTDSTGNSVTASVNVLFAECDLKLSADTINIDNARGGEQVQIQVTNGVPFTNSAAPYEVTQSLPNAGTISFDQTDPIDPNAIFFTVTTPPIAATPNDPDTIIIRDSRGCVGKVDVTITPAQASDSSFITADPTTIDQATGGTSTITFTALDINNKPLEGLTIVFTTDVGTLSSDTTGTAVTAVTDANGKATVTLNVPGCTTDPCPTSATVTATAPGGVVTKQVTITISPSS